MLYTDFINVKSVKAFGEFSYFVNMFCITCIGVSTILKSPKHFKPS